MQRSNTFVGHLNDTKKTHAHLRFLITFGQKEIVELQLINTGYFYADGGAMFGAIPKTAWSRRYPSDDSNGCVLSMRSLLVKTDDGRIILIDNGAGTKQLKRLSYYSFFDCIDLQDKLLALGVKTTDVTDVILTHLHFDHCGYSVLEDIHSNELSVAFPNAIHWVSKLQWENFSNPNPLEADSFFPENMDLIERNGLLKLIDEDYMLCEGISLRLYAGHTPGQIAVYIDSAERTYVFAGDVIPLAASISPAWISAYDTYPVASYSEKVRMLEEAVSEKQAIIFCHDAYTPCCTIRKVGSFYKKDRIIPL